MHKNDFFPFIFFSYHSFSLSYLELQIIFSCRDIGPAIATLDPRPATISQTRSSLTLILQTGNIDMVLGMKVKASKNCIGGGGFLAVRLNSVNINQSNKVLQEISTSVIPYLEFT